ncbi:linear amide C-N hydrolase [Endozoicomonas sp.]|uniref:linear amide C-N hydrolase n=1 Tax=Endozoicomonas sp. TaxID=1892382 RepID=UPI002883F1F1|nr:choloylglycine hydrolase family protein [Endozoicomonas sp.]
MPQKAHRKVSSTRHIALIQYTTTVLLLVIDLARPVCACTGITITTESNANIHARTIEWGESNLNSKLILAPRDYQYTSTLPDGKNGLSWKSKYGFAGIPVSDDRFIAEGINEAGLTAGLFYFKDYGSLARFDPAKTRNNITDIDFVRWMLSQFKTVSEVKSAMASIKIISMSIDAKGNPSPTAHWRVTDKTGENIVIEIVNRGDIHVYNNEVDVLTNSPGLPWQVTNLNNYIHLNPGSAAPKKIGKYQANSFGVGTAFAGLPGDISPPSRFIRASFYLHTAPPIKTSEDAVSQAFHILNNFDIPLGSEFGPQDRKHIPNMPSATQWTSVIDQQKGVLYFKTMYDSRIKQLDLDSVNFKQKTETKLPLDKGRFTLKKVSPDASNH